MAARALSLLLLLAACSSRHIGSAPASAGAGAGAGGNASAGAGGNTGASGNAGGGGMDSAGSAGAGSGGGGVGAEGGSAAGASTTLSPWPGGSEVVTVDAASQFNGNLSGITYEPESEASPAVLWGVSNIPGKMYRLLRAAPTSFLSDPSNGWPSGKLLHYPDGTGEADAEGVTFGVSSADGLYVVAEHDNDDAATSRLSVLRYDPASPELELSATHEWDVTSALPALNANLGLEAVTWISDEYLTEKGFFDEALGHSYEPSQYPSHAGGLFFVGVEQSGQIHGFALNHADSTFSLLTTIATPLAGVMGLEQDRDLGYLWAYCDDACGNQAAVFDIDDTAGSAALGQLTLHAHFEHPAGLPNTNHEGIALARESDCDAGLKPFFWADDNDTDGHSIRQGSIRCGAL